MALRLKQDIHTHDLPTSNKQCSMKGGQRSTLTALRIVFDLLWQKAEMQPMYLSSHSHTPFHYKNTKLYLFPCCHTPILYLLPCSHTPFHHKTYTILASSFPYSIPVWECALTWYCQGAEISAYQPVSVWWWGRERWGGSQCSGCPQTHHTVESWTEGFSLWCLHTRVER